jgi:hypothetical protein
VRRVKDGQSTGVKGKVSRESIRNALGLGGPEPKAGKVPLSPSQQREVEAGRDPGPPPPGHEVTIIEGGRDAFEHLGRPDLNSVEAGKQDGRRIVSEPPPKPEPERTNWEALDAAKQQRELEREYAETKAKLEALLAKEAGA